VIGPITVIGTSLVLSTPLTANQTYQWQVAAIDSLGVASPWSGSLTFTVPPPPSPPSVTSATPVSKKHKITSIVIAFDEALQTASADSTGFYQVARQVAIKRKKPVYGPPLAFRVNYGGNRDVTLTLNKPVTGPVRLIVLSQIVAADGTSSTQPFTLILK
jgi:hypothetical protein